MSLPWNVNASMGGAGVNYQIQRSLRFRASASAYLSRTPSVTGNQKTWTWSGWVKRGSLTTAGQIFGSNYSAGGFGAAFGNYGGSGVSPEVIGVTLYAVGTVTTNAVFRDPSAWYHIVLRFDSTQAAQANRFILYVNGVQQTLSSALNVTLNANYNVNLSGAAHGMFGDTGGYDIDGYLAEVNFIDGQALTPASFGYNDPVTGVWQPAPFKGTYGTNGFYLPFTDIATTSGSNFGLGRDYSGNANYWNTNNISVTSGSTYDSMIDSPTSFSDGSTYYNRGNYSVMNPLMGSTLPSFSNGNLTVTGNSGSANFGTSYSSIGVTSGKWYAEYTLTTLGSNQTQLGVATYIYPRDSSNQNGLQSGVVVVNVDNSTAAYRAVYQNGTVLTGGDSGFSFSAGDIVGVALNADAGNVTFYKNGTVLGTSYPYAINNTGNGTYYFITEVGNSAATVLTLNFGQRPFTYTPPTGYKALNTFNLPTPTIPNGAAYMAATTYTGNGTNQSIVNSGSFQPDFVWMKSRSNAYNNILQDSVRGAGKNLQSNTTNAETGNSGDLVSSFNSNGFTVNNTYLGGTDPSTNGSAATYIGWQWKAGAGTTSTNTSGSITSTVSANTTAGFSVVTYTSQSSGTGTIGHGLGVAPDLIINKPRTGSIAWTVYHSALGNNAYLILNTTAAQVTGATTVWNSTSPTSSVFTQGSAFAGFGTMVAYCFAAVKGYSAFGSYTGNGSTDGPFVYTGFRPRFILLKNASAASTVWLIFDTSRNTYNVANLTLQPESSAAEVTSGGWDIDILSNGFKPRNSGTSSDNGSGNTIIYAAFAENPFNYSRAR